MNELALYVLQNCYGTLLCVAIISSYLILNHKKYGAQIVRLFAITISLVLLEAICGSAERYLGNRTEFSFWRVVLSWVCYCVAPGILLVVAETILRKSKIWVRTAIVLPEIVNIIVTSTAFFGPWCFSFEADINHFVPGPLIVVPHYSVVIYLVVVFVAALANVRKSKWECTTIVAGVLLLAFNYIDETQLYILKDARETTISILVLAYFVYFVSTLHLDEVKEINQEYAKSEEKLTKEMLDQSIETLAYTIDAKDRYTKGHSSRVAKYARMIGALAGKPEEELRKIYLAGLLHDIGKISINGKIINKPGKLTDEEYEKIKQHPVYGAKILEKMKSIPYLQNGAKYHHERYDGHGYPSGLKGEEIPELARIIAVADAYDAMTSYRSYRPMMDQSMVKQEIWKGIGTQFDPRFAKVMISLIDADVNYEMREIPGEQDEITFDETDAQIVWPSLPKEQIADHKMMQETDASTLAAFIITGNHWSIPTKGVLATQKKRSVSFCGVTSEDTNFVWNTPAVLVFSSDDGQVMGPNYEELGVLMSAGYGWKTGSCVGSHSGFTKKDDFISWDNWIAKNHEGLAYTTRFHMKDNVLMLEIDNDLLTTTTQLTMTRGYKRDVYIAITGEHSAIKDFKVEK